MPTNPSPFSPTALRAAASATTTPAATSRQLPLPLQYTQLTENDIKDPALATLNTLFAQLFTHTNSLLGAGGPTPLPAGINMHGARVSNLGDPATDTDAVSQGHVQANYGGQTLSSELDIGGKYALKGLTGVTFQQNQIQQQLTSFQTAITTSTAGSSYQTLPSGLILQWGHSGVIATGPGTVVTFPIAFPTSCFIVVATDDKAGGTNEGMAVLSVSTASFTASAQGGSNGIWWLAVGI